MRTRASIEKDLAKITPVNPYEVLELEVFLDIRDLLLRETGSTVEDFTEEEETEGEFED